MDLSNLSLADARELLRRIDAAVEVAESMQERCGCEPVIDLTASARLCLPVFPVRYAAAPPKNEVLVTAIMASEAPMESPCGCMNAAQLAQASVAEAVRHIAPRPEPIRRIAPQSPDWTKAEEAQLIEMTLAGKTARDVAQTLGRTVHAVNFRRAHQLAGVIRAAREAAAATIKQSLSVERKHYLPPAAAPIDIVRPISPAPAIEAITTQVITPPAQQIEAPAPPIAAFPAPEVTTPKTRFPVTAGLPGWQRDLREHINRLGYPTPWSPELDLMLVEELHVGRKLPEIAANLGIDTSAAKQRWDFLSALERDDRGRMTLDGQSHLLTEVKARAGHDQGGAAA